jgi:hypothetical protein
MSWENNKDILKGHLLSLEDTIIFISLLNNRQRYDNTGMHQETTSCYNKETIKMGKLYELFEILHMSKP